MKRCPECHFIYEEGQIYCDMDGRKLAHDAGAQSYLEDAAPVPVGRPAQTRRRGITVLSLAAIMLGAFLPSAYYLSTRRDAPQDTEQPPPEVAAAPQSAPAQALAAAGRAGTPAPAQSPAPDVRATGGATPKATANTTTAARPLPSPSASPVPKRGEKKRRPEAERKPRAGSESRKKDSKLGSILKKTGRMLKKPFKF